MKYFIHTDKQELTYKIALLIHEDRMDKAEIEENYIQPLSKLGVSINDIITFSLKFNANGKITAKTGKEYLKKLLQALDKLQVNTLLVASGDYFKYLTTKKKVEPYYGSMVPCTYPKYEHIYITPTINYSSIFFNPSVKNKIKLSLKGLSEHSLGLDPTLGKNIIHSADYLYEYKEIKEALNNLHKYPVLTCDVETFDLKHYYAGLATIAFAWDKHNGIAINVDKSYSLSNHRIRNLLYFFFLAYKGKLIFHNAVFDLKIIIYQIFMQSKENDKAMLKGIECMTKNIEDTQLITYLATNNTAKNVLGLKENAFEYTGNYAIEKIDDIGTIDREEALEYNLIDCLATWYVYDKNYPIILKDAQEEIYKSIFLESIPVIIQMELTGMPIDIDKVEILKYKYEQKLHIIHKKLQEFPLIQSFTTQLQNEAMILKNLILKQKVKSIEDFRDIQFNPASPKHIRKLMYEYLEFEKRDFTKTKLPGTGNKTLKKLKNELMSEFNITEEEI